MTRACLQGFSDLGGLQFGMAAMPRSHLSLENRRSLIEKAAPSTLSSPRSTRGESGAGLAGFAVPDNSRGASAVFV